MTFYTGIFYGNLLMRNLEARGFRGGILSDVFAVDLRSSIFTDTTRINNYVSMS